eukprot:scaffold3084_cov144-Cylindrotheca_fusiformis.AAC.38
MSHEFVLVVLTADDENRQRKHPAHQQLYTKDHCSPTTMMICSPLAVLSLLAAPARAFVPPSSGDATTVTESSIIPNDMNIEHPLRTWLIDNGNLALSKVPTSLNDLEGFKDTMSNPVSKGSELSGSLPSRFLPSWSLPSFEEPLRRISSPVESFLGPLPSPIEPLGKISGAVESFSVSLPSLEQPLGKITNAIQNLQDDQFFQLAATPWHLEAIALFGVGSVLLWFVTTPETFNDAPYEPGTTTYSPEKAAAFYQQRPWKVVKRVLKLAFLTGTFNAGLIFDWLILGKLLKDEEYTALRRNEPHRAKVALGLCEKLGPTFIKLGQALSIRTDLVPEVYALELRQLQDAVPPFDSDIARQVLRKELGVTDLSAVFSSLSDIPVASASIGQVYKGTLAATGQEVAVKVQRPGILAEIALDLHVLRILTPLQTTLQNTVNGAKTSPEDIEAAISLVDEWGRGFVAETDYRLEAENTINFEEAMRKRGLDAVCAPPVVEELVRDKVLVTEWVDGTRLDRDASQDVPRLCGVAINAYLTMLLDTGVLRT